MARALNAFDQSIFRRGINDKPLARLLDGLVVGRIDFQCTLLNDLSEASPRNNFYWMTPVILFCSLFVVVGEWKLGRDILVKGSAQRYVNRLRAATDSQKR